MMRAPSVWSGRARKRRGLLGLSLALSILVTGCGSAKTSGIAGLHLDPGAGWATVPVSRVVAPGEVLAAWSGPEQSSLAVYRGLPIPAPNPEALASETVTRLGNLPGMSDVVGSTPTIAGIKAARVDAVGMGDGGALAPSGMGKPLALEGKPLIPTRKVMITFPRGGDTLTVVWHFPNAARSAIEPSITAALASATLEQAASQAHTY